MITTASLCRASALALLCLALAACGGKPPEPPEPPRDTSWREDDTWASSIGLVAQHENKRYPDLEIDCFTSGGPDRITLSVGQVVGGGASAIGSIDYGVLKIAGNDRRIVINGTEIVPRATYDVSSYTGIAIADLETAIMAAAPEDDIEFKKADQPNAATRYPIGNLAELWPAFLDRCKAEAAK